MSARHAGRKKDRVEPAPEGAGGAPPASPDDEIEILEVVGVNETERDTNPVPELETGREHAAHGGAAALARDLEEARREKDRCQDLYLRSQAELENFRKRTERDGEQRRDADAARLIERLLPVLDNLERALRAGDAADDPILRGIALVHQQMVEVLEREGLAPIASVGTTFDPQCHEAVDLVRGSPAAAGAVIEEMQRGYLFRDRLIRPALVRVAAGPDDDGGGHGAAGG